MKQFLTALIALCAFSVLALDDIALPLGGDFYGRKAPAVGAGESAACTSAEDVPRLQKTTLTFNAFTDTLTDGAAAGVSNLLYTFPVGRIYVVSAVINAAVTNDAGFEASPNDVWLGAIGTAAAANDATLTSTEADIIASTTFDTANGTDGHHAWKADMTAGGDSVFDGTSTAVKLYFNAAAADASITTNNATCGMQSGGTLTVYWINLGDD